MKSLRSGKSSTHLFWLLAHTVQNLNLKPLPSIRGWPFSSLSSAPLNKPACLCSDNTGGGGGGGPVGVDILRGSEARAKRGSTAMVQKEKVR